MCQLDNQRFIELRLSYFSIISQSPALDVFNLAKTRFVAIAFTNYAWQVSLE